MRGRREKRGGWEIASEKSTISEWSQEPGLRAPGGVKLYLLLLVLFYRFDCGREEGGGGAHIPLPTKLKLFFPNKARSLLMCRIK